MCPISGGTISLGGLLMKIYLSPSQQYYNKYAAGDTTEKEQCNRIAQYCEAALLRCGFEVKRAAVGTKTEVAIKESNDWGAELHVPIHTNAGGGAGCVVFVSKLEGDRLKYAQCVYDELAAITEADKSYGVRTANFLEIRDTAAKCIYVEAEFHDSVKGAEWIIENVRSIGEAICKGICKGAGVAYVEEDSEASRAKAWAISQGLIRGFADGDYRWASPLTREQFAIIEYRRARKDGEVDG